MHRVIHNTANRLEPYFMLILNIYKDDHSASLYMYMLFFSSLQIQPYYTEQEIIYYFFL